VKHRYSEFGYEKNDIKTIPNILDKRFEIGHKSNFEEPFKLLYIGSIDEHKGVDRIIDLFLSLNDQKQIKIKLTIVGDGGLRSALEKQTSNQGVSDLVEFRGQVPNNELPRVYAAHDLFVYPGRWDEPFGRIFLEAMAAGTPIVATDVGSVSDIIGEAGVVTNDSIPSIVSGICSLLDRETLLQHSKATKNEVQRFYRAEVIPQFEQLYQDVL
jgi:glycosyltransferase involved in cell wall biosynthesis